MARKSRSVHVIKIDINKDGKVDTIHIYTPEDKRYASRSKPARIWLGGEPAPRKLGKKHSSGKTKSGISYHIYKNGNLYYGVVQYNRRRWLVGSAPTIKQIEKIIKEYIKKLEKALGISTKSKRSKR